MQKHVLAIALFMILTLPSPSLARKWSDSTGRYHVKADLIAFNDNTAVLQKGNRELASVKIEQLSKADQDYLKSEEAASATRASSSGVSTWMLRNGLKVNGRVVGYGRREVVVQRKRGKLFVNDHLFDNLPGVYKRMVPKIVAHFEDQPIENEKDLMAWAIAQKGKPGSFVCEGVMLELENGDEYAVPFFFFSEEDLNVLEPGWRRWKAADDAKQQKEQKEHEELLVQAQAQAYQKDRQTQQQISQMELALLATNAGITSIWEVGLYPRRGVAAQPVSVIVPARDSRQAQAAAMNQYPNYVAGPVRKLSF